MSTILIVDDEPAICWALAQAVKDEGHHASSVPSAEAARDWTSHQTPDVIVMDVRLPGMDGLTAIESFPERLSKVPVIIMTAFGDLETAVHAISSGAFEYMVKPFDLDSAVRIIQRALANGSSDKDSGPVTLPEQNGLQNLLIGKSAPMQAVFRQIALAAEHDIPVLICGESGTGKELVASAIHKYSQRSEQPFLPVCIPAMSESLIESELFGHRSGAFTGADHAHQGLLQRAEHGIAFFDEIGDASLATQVKLLRVLESRQIFPVGASRPVDCDFRLIAATNCSLEQKVESGEFREDLYYRLNVFRINLPALRDRIEDIEQLASHFLRHYSRDSAVELTPATIAELQNRPWYGNVRELRNTIEHASIQARFGRIEPENLSPAMQKRPIQNRSLGQQHAFSLPRAITSWLDSLPNDSRTEQKILDRFLQQAEPILIQRALQLSGGNRQEAAQLLGIHRQTLRDKIRRYGIEDSET